jgi:hypothetical protein
MRCWFLSYHSPDQALLERLKAALERKDTGSQVSTTEALGSKDDALLMVVAKPQTLSGPAFPKLDPDFIVPSRKAAQRRKLRGRAIIGVLTFAVVASVIGWLDQDVATAVRRCSQQDLIQTASVGSFVPNAWVEPCDSDIHFPGFIRTAAREKKRPKIRHEPSAHESPAHSTPRPEEVPRASPAHSTPQPGEAPRASPAHSTPQPGEAPRASPAHSTEPSTSVRSLMWLGFSLIAVASLFWLLRRVGAAPVQELLRKILINPEAADLWLPGRLTKSDTTPQDVDVTVFAPPAALPGEEVMAQVIFHTPDREVEALDKAEKAEPAGRALASVPLTIRLHQSDNIKVSVECVDARIREPVQSIVWNGRLVFLYFRMRMPNVETIIRPKLRVFVNGVPAGSLVFKILVQQNPPDLPPSPANETVRTFRKSFLSYASEDRVQALKAAQFLHSLKIDFFQDVLHLAPGERWERRLYTEIDNCDLFLLFWSHHAQQSVWVIREAEYAQQRAKVASLEIVPILLEGPPPPRPPECLKDIHFNDPIRYIIFAEESVMGAK